MVKWSRNQSREVSVFTLFTSVIRLIKLQPPRGSHLHVSFSCSSALKPCSLMKWRLHQSISPWTVPTLTSWGPRGNHLLWGSCWLYFPHKLIHEDLKNNPQLWCWSETHTEFIEQHVIYLQNNKLYSNCQGCKTFRCLCWLNVSGLGKVSLTCSNFLNCHLSDLWSRRLFSKPYFVIFFIFFSELCYAIFHVL